MSDSIGPGPRNLITDVRGVRVGNAQDLALKSGTTVLIGEMPFVASVHVMGGAPGTRETDLLAPDKTVNVVDALVLSGGSAFGLDACSGVADALVAAGRGFAIGPVRVPIVPGAIIFDLINGGQKDWAANPYHDLGVAAFRAVENDFAIGTAGAGVGALAAMQKGGLGSASLVLPGGVTVGALVVANPLGSVTTPGGQHFWAAPFEIGREFGGFGPDPRGGLHMPEPSAKLAAMGLIPQDQSNTTIAIIATDATLTKAQCHRVAVAAHDGMARAIVPSHTPMDGDLVFACAIGHDSDPVDDPQIMAIGHAAAVCLARAIARGVYAATAQAGDILPIYQAKP